MNWGGFGAGFSQGFNNGVKMGKDIRSAMKERELQIIQEKGIAEATAARNQQIDNLVKSTPGQAAPVSDKPLTDAQPVQTGAVPSPDGAVAVRPLDAPAPSMPVTADTNPTDLRLAASAGDKPQPLATPAAAAAQGIAPQPAAAPQQAPQQAAAPMPFMVGSQGFKTREEATKAAEAHVGSLSDFIFNTVAPKKIEFLIGRGDIEQAEQLQKYMDSRKGKQATAEFSKAMSKMMLGDTDGGVKQAFNYISKYADPDIEYKSHTIGEDGKINAVIRRKGSDKDITVSLSPAEVLQLGMMHDPAANYASLLERQKTQEKARAETAKEDRKFKRDVFISDRKADQAKELAGVKHGNDMEKMSVGKLLDQANVGAKQRAEFEGKVGLLKESGYSDDDIKKLAPAMLKLTDTKKVTDPTERRAIVTSELLKSDPMFARKPEADQKKQVDQVMGVIYRDEQDGAAAKPKAAAPAAPQYVKDTKAGEIFKIENGKRVPVGAKPAAKGLP